MDECQEPLTLDELIDQLVKLRASYPDWATRPVHMLELQEDGDGLVTEVETDCFDARQGPVTSLMSWRSGQAKQYEK